MKKIISIFLAVVMIVLMLPISALVASAANSRYADGTILHYTNFADATANELSTYYNKVVGGSSGYSASLDADKGYYLKGSGSGIGMTSATALPDLDDFVVEVAFATDYKIANIAIGWTDTPTTSVTTSNFLRFNYTGGPTDNKVFSDEGNYPNVAGNFVMNANNGKYFQMYKNENDNSSLTLTQAKNVLRPFLTAGAQTTISLEVKGGKLAKAYVSAAGETVSYAYNEDVAVGGYFSVWLLNWTSSCSAYIKTLKVKAGGFTDAEIYTSNSNIYTPPASAKTLATAGEVLHNFSLGTADDLDSVPYNTVVNTENGSLTFKNEALWLHSASNTDAHIKIDGELFGGLRSYTLDLDISGGSAAWILYTCLGMTSDSELTGGKEQFKIRTRSDTGGGSDSNYVYSYNSSSGMWAQANASNIGGMSETMFANIVGGADYRIKLFVEDGFLTYATITVGTETSKIIKPKNTASEVASGDIAIAHIGAGNTGFKNIRIVAGTRYGELNWGDNAEDANVFVHSDSAIVKCDNNITVLSAGSSINWAAYLSNTVAVKKNAKPEATSASIEAQGGSFYVPMNISDVKNYISSRALESGSPQLRLASNPGIRFTSNFAAADYTLIMELVNKATIVDVKMGTLVTLDTHLAKVDEFTADALNAYGESVEKTVYMDITGNVSMLYLDNTFAGSVIGVTNYTRNYVARAYVTLTLSDKTVVTLYTGNQTASVKALAQAIVEAGYPGYTSDAEKAALDYLATYTVA